MEQIIEYAGLIGIGTLIGIIIQYFLDKNKLKNEREYLFNKEELVFYRSNAEKIIQKLLLLENHRELLMIYLKLTQEAYNEPGANFKDLNDTFNKRDFEINKEEITSLIYMYFEELGSDWNECLGLMGRVYNDVFHIKIHNDEGITVDINEVVGKFNSGNEKLGDRPSQLAKKIKDTVITKELLLKK